jgi:uncharacterized protein (DUF433 family)
MGTALSPARYDRIAKSGTLIRAVARSAPTPDDFELPELDAEAGPNRVPPAGSRVKKLHDMAGCRRDIPREAPMTKHERIEINPEIMGGRPVIRGTRLPVEIVLRKLGAGMAPEAITADHPRLTLDDIHAAQAFAADYLADEALVYG